MIIANELVVKRGDHREITFKVKRSDSSPYDLTDVGILFAAVTEPESDTTSILRRNTDAGGNDTEINMTDPANGEFLLILDTDSTKDLDVGTYVYYIQKIEGTEYRVILESKITIQYGPPNSPP